MTLLTNPAFVEWVSPATWCITCIEASIQATRILTSQGDRLATLAGAGNDTLVVLSTNDDSFVIRLFP